MSQIDQILIQQKVMYVFTAIIEKGSEQNNYFPKILQVVIKFLKKQYWPLELIFIQNIQNFGFLFKKEKCNLDILIEYYKKFLKSENGLIIRESVVYFKDFCEFLDIGTIDSQFLQILQNHIDNEELKSIVIEKVFFLFRFENSASRKYLKQILEELKQKDDYKNLINVFIQLEYIKDLMDQDDLVKFIIRTFQSCYENCKIDFKFKMTFILILMLKILKSVAKNKLFLNFLEKNLLSDETYIIRTNTIEQLVNCQELTNTKEFEKNIVSLIMKFKDHCNYQLRLNVAYFALQNQYQLSEDKQRILVDDLSNMLLKDNIINVKYTCKEALEDIQKKTSNKILKRSIEEKLKLFNNSCQLKLERINFSLIKTKLFKIQFFQIVSAKKWEIANKNVQNFSLKKTEKCDSQISATKKINNEQKTQ